MEGYINPCIVENEDPSPSISISPFHPFPELESYRPVTPFFYTRKLLPNGFAIISTQMDHQSHGSNITMVPTVPSPHQSSFAEYWHQVSSHENPHIGRRHSSSTASDGSTSTSSVVQSHPHLVPSSLRGSFSRYSIPETSSNRDATAHHVPQLQLNTGGLASAPGVPVFLPSHPVNFSPTSDLQIASAMSNETWTNGPSPIDNRGLVFARDYGATGAPREPGSTPPVPIPVWQNIPRSGLSSSSIIQWNQSSASWLPQTSAMVNVSHPHYTRAREPDLLPILPPVTAAFNGPLPVSDSTLPPRPNAAAAAAVAPYPTSRTTSNETLISRPGTHLVDRTTRPTLAVRRRSSSTAVNGTTVKRKPLPKVYGCDGCGKKFDRPSTLKVHEAIHTGAKDHLCEYCIRAFTVQSNMKRHMRVCKHKPLSPPMSLCYILCTTPPLSAHTNLVFPPSFRAMDPVDRSSNLILGGSNDADSSNATPSASSMPSRYQPVVHTANGNVTMIPFEHPYELPQGSIHPGPAPTVKGYKAPMIIAAMFSVQQNVPASVARLTLVHLECDIPLPPVVPHPMFEVLYSEPPEEYFNSDKAEANAECGPTSSAFDPPLIKNSLPSSSSSVSIVSSTTLTNGPYIHSSLASSSLTMVATSSCLPDSASTLTVDGGDEETHKARSEDKETNHKEDDTTDLQTKGAKPLTDIRFEERNSLYPRSRYCYHPAEYDPIAILPGSGTVALPSEEDLEHQELRNEDQGY